MEITEVRIKLMETSEDRLRGFCSITIDGAFVVRDLKIIDGTNGPFVAMPSRKMTGHCRRCGSKNHLRANYCNQCGARLRESDESVVDSPQKLYADIAHPINSRCREQIQRAVIDEFNAELNRSQQPGYRSRYDDDFDAGPTGDFVDDHAEPTKDAAAGNVANQPTRPSAPVNASQRNATRPSAAMVDSRESIPAPHFPTTRDSGQRAAKPSGDQPSSGSSQRHGKTEPPAASGTRRARGQRPAGSRDDPSSDKIEEVTEGDTGTDGNASDDGFGAGVFE